MQLRIIAKPNSKIAGVERDFEGNIRIRIQAPPIDGKANKYLVDYLSKKLALPKSAIVVEKGTTSKYKSIEIDADEAYVMQKLFE